MATIKNLAELKVRGVLEENDELTFVVKTGDELHYTVRTNFAGHFCKNDGSPWANGAVFSALGVEKVSFSETAIGGKVQSPDGSWPNTHTLEDLTKVVEALYIEIARQGWKDTMVIRDLAELKVRGELHQDDTVVFTVGGASFRHNVNDDHLSYERGSNDRIFDKLGVNAEEFCSQAYGYEHEGGLWPESHYHDFAALTRAVEAVYIEIARQELHLPKTESSPAPSTKTRAGQGGAPYREGDVVRTPHGGYRRILDVLDGGKRFFLSDGWATIPALNRDPSPRVLGTEVTLEELKRGYTRVAPETPAAPAVEEHRFAEGDLIYDPEDEGYARILAASSDGNIFALSQWTTDRSDEDMLSTPDEVFTLEEIKECNYILAPAEEPKKVLHLTRDQIAEKFGVDPDQLEIHDEAA